MIEGLWVVQFLEPNDPDMDLNGGVVVIETDRLLGGDSGYYYVGKVEPLGAGRWHTALDARRHDSNIASIFGDVDHIPLQGVIERLPEDILGRPRLLVTLQVDNGDQTVSAGMTRVAELP